MRPARKLTALIALGAAIALTGCTKKNGVAATGNVSSAVVTVAQLAPARPDAGVPGNGTALPAITTAVLGGVAITGGIGRVAGVVLATLLIVWLNAGILPAFVGNERSQYQLLVSGTVLIFATLLNRLANRRYGGSR